MDVIEAIRTRRTIRKFTGETLPESALETIVDAGHLAASGMNTQPWEFVIITDPTIMAQLRIPENHWSCTAGAYIAVVMDPKSRWWMEDASAAIQNMLLAAWALGYGGCWMESYTGRNETAFKKVLGIPDPLRLFCLVAFGVPAEHPTIEKKALSEVLRWQRYSEP